MKLELVGISCGYGGKKVLDGINMEVASGDICCILGPNGVGKTTLFKTILKLIKPLGGQVMIDGDDISKWSEKRMAEKIAYVAQSHIPPFPYIVKDIIMLGRISSVGYFGQPSRYDYEVVEQVMDDMGISHLRERVYTDVSGGERQMVMIARALAQEPEMLVLDEPTSSLDYGNMLKVINRIRNLRSKGYGVIMTTHNPDHAFMCEAKTMLLQSGSRAVFGRASEVVTEKNLKEAYGADVKVIEYTDANGRFMKLCAPVFSDKQYQY